ncbi:hypothetical protein H072_11521 [Dactylellina haptotyla CBS 200.50]|uniref:DUF5672 domain-containing protein n=1 Tax=Dactylellina haptotyla (strain CBS 200.50) TaxID=1284197 RepID=S8BIZ1_DACHA|nr:hypothetical protein H072_11521 [Dactylellina haptotyla CBS 200.50]
MKVTLDLDHFQTYAATQYYSVNPRNRKFVFLLPISLALVWFMWLFGPSHETVKSAMPKVSVNYHPNRPPPSPYNETKLALLIETRPLGHLAPLLLHMITVVPPDWRFLFLGTNESIAHLNASLPVQMHERNGKLDLRLVPDNLSVAGQEQTSKTFTNLWFYEEVLGGKRGVENLLVFQTDSILCANSELSINDWLDYDWVGAPWNLNDRFGGNGGLSLRKISKIRQVLTFQNRIEGTEPEDLWLINRIGLLPNANMATPTQESEFSVEQVWHQSPMGFHLGWGGARLPEGVWDKEEQRKRVYEYCPEIKMIMKMRLEREKCSPEEIANYKAAHPNEKREELTENSFFPVPFGRMR